MGPVAAIDQNLMRRHFSGQAGQYDQYAEVQQRTITHLLERLDPKCADGPVLDIGTGTGALALAMEERRVGPSQGRT